MQLETKVLLEDPYSKKWQIREFSLPKVLNCGPKISTRVPGIQSQIERNIKRHLDYEVQQFLISFLPVLQMVETPIQAVTPMVRNRNLTAFIFTFTKKMHLFIS